MYGRINGNNLFKDHLTVSSTTVPDAYANIDSQTYTMSTNIGASMDDYLMNAIVNEVTKKMDVKPMINHKCNNCGAVIKLDIDKHIFWCEYCGSTYAIGTMMINDVI